MLDLVRTSLHRAITTPIGDGFAALRLSKDLARRMNAMFGEPLCSREELGRRRSGRARLAELKRGNGTPSAASTSTTPTQAPVLVYFEKDRSERMLRRIRELLDSKAIAYTLLDVSDDEVTRDFVFREANCKIEDLPVVFVADAPVGGYDELVAWDVSGRLAKALAGR